ncbi:hypothetical protein DC915_RS02730 [Vibrio parahaemolyticus]|nr:hypothetical protein [Vibrio parahaemolyticus]EJG0009893.1 hypothetical protein [Vibrio parahaemolyticus]
MKRGNPITQAKEMAAKLLSKTAERDYKEDSFWADPTKRKIIVACVALGAAYYLSTFLPETRVAPKSSIEDRYSFAIDDLTGDEKHKRPKSIFSEAGADRLDAIESQDLVKAMEEEMKIRERDLTQREQEIAQEIQDKDEEMEQMHLQNAQALRDIKQDSQSKLKQAEIDNRQNAQKFVNALINGEDPNGIIKGVKVPEGLVLTKSENINAPAAMTPTVVIGPDGKPQQTSEFVTGTRRSAMAKRNNTATGLRIMNASGNFRVASGQTLDMNNQESMRQMAMNAGENLDSTDDVFTRLAKKKAELAAKRTQLANAAEIQAEEAKAKAEYEANIVPLTAGSVISGTLINGMYVPTGSSSSNEPMPALFRVKKEAIMPNYFVSDEVVECVIVAGSRPAIESIRVIFRASTITCIREDGRATEDSIRATSTGPDGVTGVPAKLISRNSEMLAKTAMAGFLNGLTEIFSQTSLEVNEEDGVYAISGGDLAKLGGSAALGGAGEALTRLADYYMTLADKMQPTLLVNPGIEVDFLVTSMSQLDFNKSDAKVK